MKDHVSRLASNNLPNVGLLGCEGALLACGQLVVYQDPKVLLGKAAFQLAPRMCWGYSSLDAGLCISPFELHEIPLCPLLQPVKLVPPKGGTII